MTPTAALQLNCSFFEILQWVIIVGMINIMGQYLGWDFLCLCLDYIKILVLFKLQLIFLVWLKNLQGWAIFVVFYSQLWLLFVLPLLMAKTQATPAWKHRKMSQFYIASRESNRRTEKVVTFIHTKLNFKSWYETHQVMMHCFHAISAIGIASCCLGLRRVSFPSWQLWSQVT